MNHVKWMSLCSVVALSVFGGEVIVSPQGLSPQEALLQVRAQKAKGNQEAWTVRVKEGVYPLQETLTFTPVDSGTPQAPVTWVGEGQVLLVGGERIQNWTDEGTGVWSAPIPKAPNGKCALFEQLWVNGARAVCARLPKEGYYHLSDVTNYPCAQGGGFMEETTFTNQTLRAALAQLSPEDWPFTQMCLIEKWSFARRTLFSYDAAKGCVQTKNAEPLCSWKMWNPKGSLISFENVRSAFTEPGEWFYDAKKGRIYYRPRAGETIAHTQIVAPSAQLSQLVRMRGESAQEKYVHDVVFKNIQFAYSDVTATHPPMGFRDVFARAPAVHDQHQAAVGSDGALTFEGTHRVRLEKCTVAHTGNYALRFDDGCVSNVIEQCTLTDLGAGGIWMGARSGHVAKGESLTRRVIRMRAPQSTAFNRIENCHIHQGGRFNPEGTGIVIGHASDCRVLHNEIHDFYYTGVSVGWTWGFRSSVAQRNEIAYNKIYDLGKHIMSDMGGVYTLGTSFGTRVHHNVIHDVWAYTYGGWALYTDEGSEGIVMDYNLCWNTTDAGFHQHYGTGCVIRNNIFAWNEKEGAVRTARKEVQQIPCTLHFVNNIVVVRSGPLVSNGPLGVGGVWANNVWFDYSGNPPVLNKLDWKAWCATGKESGSIYADPQFENPEKNDFRLKDSSPAFKLGFKKWDWSTAGISR